MNAQFNSRGNAGFTLVEMLVTVLIIVILAVVMLPMLQPFVRQAQYAAEGVPVVGNIRTKVELYRVEHGYLPGVPVVAGKVTNIDPDAEDSYSTSYFTGPDTVADVEDVDNGVHDLTVEAGDEAAIEHYRINKEDVTEDEDMLANHAWKNISVNFSDLTGTKLRPEHMQYIAFCSGGDHFYYVVACFGDGTGLAKGCGYAVAEYNNPVTKHKMVATFELYKPVCNAQLKFKPGTSSGDATPEDGEVFIPNLQTLDTGFDSAVNAMRSAGWKL